MGLGLGFTLNGEFPVQLLGFRVRVIHLDLEVGLELFPYAFGVRVRVYHRDLGPGGLALWTWAHVHSGLGVRVRVYPRRGVFHSSHWALGLG